MSADRALTALVVPVPEAEHALRPWRAASGVEGRHELSAHVTILHPFLEPAEIEGELERLRAHFAAVARFSFALRETRRYPGGVLYLAPEPVQAFATLLRDLHALYPDRPPYGCAYPDVVPHCTVAHVDDDALLDAADAAVRRHLPLHALALEAWLLELVAEGWSVRARLPFGA